MLSATGTLTFGAPGTYTVVFVVRTACQFWTGSATAARHVTITVPPG
jgi:hypothetical protein